MIFNEIKEHVATFNKQTEPKNVTLHKSFLQKNDHKAVEKKEEKQFEKSEVDLEQDEKTRNFFFKDKEKNVDS